MAFEMICGQCRGNLLVEQFGVVVACPHCGAHLSIPAPEGSVPPVSAPPVADEQIPFFGEPTPDPSVSDRTPPQSIPDNPTDLAVLFGVSESTPVIAEEPLSPEPVVSEATEPIEPAATEIAPTVADVEVPSVNMSASGLGLSALIGGVTITETTDSTPSELDGVEGSSETAVAVSDSAEPDSNLSPTKTADGSKAIPQLVDADHVLMAKTSVLLLLSYTSAVTIGFLYLFFHLMNHKDADYGLESLPDLVPKKKNVSILLVPERSEMPDGHELKIGESQTFGHIKVTVTKVTRGPIQFVHHSRKSDDVRLPSSPVLKLWLKFENVSQDQEIPPLDSQLLFSRSGKTRFDWRANQFICREEDKANTDKRKIYVYDHNFQSPWNLANLPLDKPLKPKESREYYVPSAENDLELLTGSLLWRVHFRKGYSPKGNGVTTIFEVHFESNEIKDEQA